MSEKTLNVICTEIQDGQKIPLEYTGRGQDISPEFIIKNLSSEAKTLAITLEDMSHPIKNFTHWIIWNIPATNKIEKGIPTGKTVLQDAKQGLGYGVHRYAGPKPPKGKSHIYRFSIYSLDCVINLSANATKTMFMKKAKEHIIQAGSITGEFE